MAQDTTPAIVVYQGDGTNRVFSIPFDAGSGVINVEFILRGATQTYEYSPLAFTVNDDNTALTWNGEPLQVGDFVCISRSTTAHSLAMYEGDGVQTEFEIPFIRGFYGSIGVAFVYRGATQTYEYNPKTFSVDADNTLLTWTGATLNAGDYITIGRSTITGQPYELPNNQKHIEGALDNLSRQIQELKDRAVLVIDPTYRIGAPGKQNPIDWLKSIVRSKDFSVRGLRYDGKFLQFSLDDPDMPEHSKSWVSLLNTINVTTFREVYNEDEDAYYLQYSKDNGSTWHAVGIGKGDIDKILEQANAYSDEQNALLESRINGKFTAVNAQIDANADAIQKTREDYIQADSEIHQILNNHAENLTTLHNDVDDLGDQVAGIEEKIPESASATNPLVTKEDLESIDLEGYATTEYVNAREQEIRDDINQADSELQSQITAQASAITANTTSINGVKAVIPDNTSDTNPLINKQQLLDEEMDIRKDLNEGLSELQTQITAQAAEIAGKQDELIAGDNIIISNNVISATGAGGGTGFDVQVVQELPATGQKGIIYLLAKDGAAPDVYDEYVWIDATQTFELIGTTQVDLTDYVKNTDYATSSKGGVIKVNSTSCAISVTASGLLYASTKSLSVYNDAQTTIFIGKGTLENIKDDYVKRGVTANTIALTDEEKASARQWQGATRVIIRKWS